MASIPDPGVGTRIGERVVLVPMETGSPDRALDLLEAAVRVALEEMGGLDWLERGDRVLLKPAANSANVYPATTRPELVTVVARVLLAEGAGSVVVADHPGVQTVHHTRESTQGSTREVLETNGLARAAEAGGASVHGFEEPGYDAFFVSEGLAESHWSGPIVLPDRIREVDHILYLTRVSAHTLAGSTLALKNAVGWLREDSRLELHRDADSFLEKCAEINAAPELAVRIRGVLTDATLVQSTFGPDAGWDVALDPPLLLGSRNLALHDVAAHGVLTYARNEHTPWIAKAVEPYPTFASAMNRAFVAMEWDSDEPYRGYDAPTHGRALENGVIRRGVELLSPDAPRPELVWAGTVPDLLREAVEQA